VRKKKERDADQLENDDSFCDSAELPTPQTKRLVRIALRLLPPKKPMKQPARMCFTDGSRDLSSREPALPGLRGP